MPMVSIKIFEKGDGRQFEELPGTKRKEFLSALPWSIGLIQHGMESGRHSVMLNVLLPDGTMVILEQSLANWEGISAAFRGAQERWAEGG
jgi:hypothetical protein